MILKQHKHTRVQLVLLVIPSYVLVMLATLAMEQVVPLVLLDITNPQLDPLAALYAPSVILTLHKQILVLLVQPVIPYSVLVMLATLAMEPVVPLVLLDITNPLLDPQAVLYALSVTKVLHKPTPVP